jgi:hypothetical protein
LLIVVGIKFFAKRGQRVSDQRGRYLDVDQPTCDLG